MNMHRHRAAVLIPTGSHQEDHFPEDHETCIGPQGDYPDMYAWMVDFCFNTKQILLATPISYPLRTL